MQKVHGIWEWKHKASHAKETGYEHMIDTLNIISVEAFKKLSADEQKFYVAEVLRKIREVNIYPIYYFNEAGIKDEICRCILHTPNYVNTEVAEDGHAGKVLLDYMFPNLHLAEAGNTDNNCMYSRFYDDAKLSKCLTRHMKNYAFTNMRTPFFMYGRFFWNTAVNFSPMRAKAIFETFCPPDGVIYDFSAGYGGRMLGALSSRNQYTYIGCEPCSDTFYNLNKLGRYIEQVTGRADSYTIHYNCSELLTLKADSVDFAFSCPPYFKLERYSDEATQSTVKHPTYQLWLSDYVVPTLQHIYKALKPDGRLGFVIAKRIYRGNAQYDLAADWCKAASECGFTFVKQYPIRTRSRKKQEDAEALYIFGKGMIR